MDKELKEYLQLLLADIDDPSMVNVGAFKLLLSKSPKERLDFINTVGSLSLTNRGDKVVSCSEYSNAICGLYKVKVDGNETSICTGPLVRKRTKRSLTWTLLSFGVDGTTTTYDSYGAAESCPFNTKNVRSQGRESTADADDFTDLFELVEDD